MEVRVKKGSGLGRHHSITIISLIVAAMTCAGCVASSLPGIPAQGAAGDPDLQDLARRALRHQDKSAQLALGIRYEFGRGVPMNWTLAARLYLAAAKGSPGGILGYANQVGGIPMNIAIAQRGLPEAKVRLAALRAKMKAAGYRCSGAGWSTIFC